MLKIQLYILQLIYLQVVQSGTQQGTYISFQQVHLFLDQLKYLVQTPVFIDTRADTSAYSAGSIPETQDQPTTIQNYYLQRIRWYGCSYTEPYFLDGSNNIKNLQLLLLTHYYKHGLNQLLVSSTDGYAISYNLGTSGSGQY